jgi:hypothetical protein
MFPVLSVVAPNKKGLPVQLGRLDVAEAVGVVRGQEEDVGGDELVKKLQQLFLSSSLNNKLERLSLESFYRGV